MFRMFFFLQTSGSPAPHWHKQSQTCRETFMVSEDLRLSSLHCVHGSLVSRSAVQSSHFLLRDLKPLHKQEVLSQSLTCMSCQEVSGVTWLICCSTGNVKVELWPLNKHTLHAFTHCRIRPKWSIRPGRSYNVLKPFLLKGKYFFTVKINRHILH